jgi:hypothetical protein
VTYVGRSENPELELPALNQNKIKAREENAIKLLKEEASRIGIGVTREAQEIFNALSKT